MNGTIVLRWRYQGNTLECCMGGTYHQVSPKVRLGLGSVHKCSMQNEATSILGPEQVYEHSNVHLNVQLHKGN